jgi:hypothetical protein
MKVCFILDYIYLWPPLFTPLVQYCGLFTSAGRSFNGFSAEKQDTKDKGIYAVIYLENNVYRNKNFKDKSPGFR